MSFKVYGLNVNVTKFPDGTSQIWKVNEAILNYVIPEIVWDYEDEGETPHRIVESLGAIPKGINMFKE